MKVICAWCIPPRLMFEKEPFDDQGETHGMCPDCYAKMMESSGKKIASLPEDLGNCEITRVEEEGDIHVLCGDNLYKVTTSGEVIDENEPPGLKEEGVDFVKLATEG